MRMKKSLAKVLGPMTIVVDSREQLPYSFAGLSDPLDRPIAVTRAALPAGDYSLLGHETQFSVERKSLADAYATFAADRDRFTRELEKLRTFEFAAILVESTWSGMLRRPPHVTRVEPATVINSLLSWSIEYGVHVFAADDRTIGRALVFRLAQRFWRLKHDPDRRRPCSTSPSPAA